jgi:hypothetical protein
MPVLSLLQAIIPLALEAPETNMIEAAQIRIRFFTKVLRDSSFSSPQNYTSCIPNDTGTVNEV